MKINLALHHVPGPRRWGSGIFVFAMESRPPASPGIFRLIKRPLAASEGRRKVPRRRSSDYGVVSTESNYQRDLQRWAELNDRIAEGITNEEENIEEYYDADEERAIRERTFGPKWCKRQNKICIGNLSGKPPRRGEFQNLSEATEDTAAPLTDAPRREELVRQDGMEVDESKDVDPKKVFLAGGSNSDTVPLDQRLVLRRQHCRDVIQMHEESLTRAESIIKKFAKERLIEENVDMAVLQTIFMTNAQADGLQEMDVEMPDGSVTRRVLPYHVQSVSGEQVPDVRINCRAFEEDVLLRSAVSEWGERRCLKDDNCEGMLLSVSKQSPLREVVWQEEWEHFCRTGVWKHVQAGESRRRCLLCCRKSAMKAYFVAKGSMMSMNSQNHMLLRFYNIADLPGEYPASCLIWNTGKEYLGLYGPVVQYCVHDYASRMGEVSDKHRSYRVVRFTQPGVPQVDMDGRMDFCRAPSSTPASSGNTTALVAPNQEEEA